MNFGVAMIEGYRDIWSHKLRSFLTILGVVFGVSSLATMFAITAGQARSMRQHLEQSGDLEKMRIEDASPPPAQLGLAEISPGRTYEDVIALRKASPLISWVAGTSEQGMWVSKGNEGLGVNVVGGDQDYFFRDKHRMGAGRFINEIDVERKHFVCVLGSRVWERLFKNMDAALGATIRLGGLNFKVVGCLPKYMTYEQEQEAAQGVTAKRDARRIERGVSARRGRGWDPFPWKNHLVVIPITTMQSTFKSALVTNGVDAGPNRKLSSLQVGVKDVSQMLVAVDQVTNTLRQTHRGIEDFSVERSQEEIDKIDGEVERIRLSGGLIAGIGLLVGGIGITNIMLASIVDRIREIGIRRAIGARPHDVFIQVMMESFLLALFGGILGIVTTLALIYFLDQVVQIPARPILEPLACIISFSFALVTGVLAGLYPAIKASSLRPVEALKFN